MLSRVAGILVMPKDGVEAVVRLIDSAEREILLKMFTFDSPALIAAMLAAAGRGVAVRAMVNPQRSSGTRANDVTVDTLRSGGVDIRWTSPHFAVTHEKSMVIDGRVVLIATFNFVDKYFTHTRDYGVLIEDRLIIAQVAACFEADWNETRYEVPPDSPLVLSNQNARHAMAQFIDEAKHSLWVQHPKFSDMTIIDRLLDARARSVKVNVLSGGRHGISPSDMLDTFSALRTLARAGVHVHQQHGLRLHAKLILADGKRAFLGSMNIDRSAFDLRRELGVVFDDAAAVGILFRQFDADWDESKRYDAPDPILLDLQTAVDHAAGASDADLDHE